MLVAFSVTPLGTGEAVGEVVAEAVRVVRESGRWIYLNILNRCPDGGGAAYWTQQLDDGMGRWVFARRIDYSNENIASNNILPLYGQLLNR